jgi:hypothetical protein
MRRARPKMRRRLGRGPALGAVDGGKAWWCWDVGTGCGDVRRLSCQWDAKVAFGAGDGCKRAGKAAAERRKEDNETDGEGVYRKLPSGLMVADGSRDAWESN